MNLRTDKTRLKLLENSSCYVWHSIFSSVRIIFFVQTDNSSSLMALLLINPALSTNENKEQFDAYA